MSRLVDADTLKVQIDGLDSIFGHEDLKAGLIIGGALNAVDSAPTVDAVPVARGHWMPYYRDILQCSNCKITTSVPYMGGHYKYDYCPHCGAKMDVRDGTE